MRGYQVEFSVDNDEMFNFINRERKAKTMVAILRDYLGNELTNFNVLNIGGSAGIIDEYLARYFGCVTGIDIDERAIKYAKEKFNKENLNFEVGDAMSLRYKGSSFDVVICSQVYEHVPSADQMLSEIYRVLKPCGVCYFAAGNRLMFNEPHYNLPLLSVIPRSIAHYYLRLSGKGDYYYEKHKTYWGLKKLAKDFIISDYTKKIIASPNKYLTNYMISPNSAKQKIASIISRYAVWLMPGYIWILKKPDL